MVKEKFNLTNKTEISKAIKKLNRTKSIKKDYFNKLMFAHGEAEKAVLELEGALQGNILKVKGLLTKQQVEAYKRSIELESLLDDEPVLSARTLDLFESVDE